MTTTAVTVGTGRTLTHTFKNSSNLAVDPTSVTLTIREPDGNEISKTGGELTHATASPPNGTYSFDHIFTKEGRTTVHWDGDGVEAAAQHEFYVVRKVTS